MRGEAAMDSNIKIPKKKLKGEDGHKTFSVRVPDELYNDLNDFVNKTELSRNEVITIFLKEALSIAVIEDITEK